MPTPKPKKQDGWYAKKAYPHFDLPLSFDHAKQYVTDKKRVSAHAFHPFLAFDITRRRFRKVNKQIKISEKSRPIRVAPHVDGYIYAYYAKMLADQYEAAIKGTNLDRAVLAYRKNLGSNIDFAKRAFDEVERRGGCVALAMDLESFFDSIDHAILKNEWARLLGQPKLPADHYAVFKAVTRYARIDRDACYRRLGITDPEHAPRPLCAPSDFRAKVRGDDGINTNLIEVNRQPFGIPQGSQISAILSNIYMFSFDRDMSALADRIGAYYRRYCDDILWICSATDQALVERETAAALSRHCGAVKVNGTKTIRSEYRRSQTGKLTCVARPLQYLGFEFTGSKRLVRSSTLSRFWRRVVFGVRGAKSDAAKAARRGGSSVVYKRSIYRRFTHLGGANFIRYAIRASRKMKGGGIKGQLRGHWRRVQEELSKPLK